MSTAAPRPTTTVKPRAAKTPPQETSVAPASSSPPLTGPFTDTFERAELGPDWRTVGTGWSIRDGKLCAQNVHNKAAWLQRAIPTNARIEFEAMSTSPEGDLKAEIWGDGHSGATARSYTNATSYLVIFGGWKNTLHVLARIDEHGPDRLEVPLSQDSIPEREKPVIPNRTYAFKIERSDSKTVSWWVDGNLIHRLEDKNPLAGPGHDHFGFNNWEALVCFDDLKVTPL